MFLMGLFSNVNNCHYIKTKINTAIYSVSIFFLFKIMIISQLIWFKEYYIKKIFLLIYSHRKNKNF